MPLMVLNWVLSTDPSLSFVASPVFQRLRSDLATVERQLATAKTQLEEETLRRVDYENRLQSMKEDLAFKSQMFETVWQCLLMISPDYSWGY